MAGWAEFQIRAPELAHVAERSFNRFEVVILGTTRPDAAPRLSLVEPRLIDQQLVIGALTGDAKTEDLRRDPRCSLHSLVSHRTHVEPVFRALLRVSEVRAPALPRYARALQREEIGWLPTAVFECRIHEASVTSHGRTTTWSDPNHRS